MQVIGLTSGPGCGKSTVAKSFRTLGARVIDADVLTHSLYHTDRALAKRIAREFGQEFLTPSGKVRRRRLSSLVFSSRSALGKLNRITHPKIIREIKRKLSRLRKTGRLRRTKRIVVIDAPLLIETGLHRLCDSVVVVTLPKELQIKRLMQTGLSRSSALARISSQKPLRDKIKIADHLIDNSRGLARTRAQVRALCRELTEPNEP